MSCRRTAIWPLVLFAILALPACQANPTAQKRVYLENGDRLIAEKKYAQAIIEYRNAVRVDERDGDARHRLAKAYVLSGERPRALREFVRAADLSPDDTTIQLDAGRALLTAGLFEDARSRAEKVLQKDTRNVDAHVLRASAAAGLRDYTGAITFVEDALKVDDTQGVSFMTLGTLQAGTGKTVEAEASFKRAIDVNPRSAIGYVALANYYWVTGRAKEAEQWALKATEVEPNSPVANNALANFYRSTGRAALAEAPLKRIVESTGAWNSRAVLADYYFRLRRYDEARLLLNELAKDESMATWARVRLAQADYAESKRDPAHRAIDEMLKEQPGNAELMVVKAQWLLTENKTTEALAQAEAAVASRPELAEAHQALARVRLAQLNYEGAHAAYQETLKLAPDSLSTQIALADLSLVLRRPDAALNYAQQAVRNAPLSGGARLALAASLFATGDTNGAEAQLRLVLNAAPDLAPAQTLFGKIQHRKKNFAAARQAYEKALALRKGEVDAVAGLIALDVQEKKVASAQKRADDYVATNAGGVPGLLVAARAHATGGNFPRAEELLKTAIGQNPSAAEPYRMLGQLYVRQNRIDDARREYEAIVRERPNDVAARTMVGMMLQVQGRMEEARKVYEQAVTANPQAAALAANNLAYMHAEEGSNLDRALNLAQAAKAALPTDPDIDDTLGWVYYKRGLPKMAIEPLQQSVKSDPSNATYHYHLGLALVKAGDQQRGKATLERALKLEPNAPLATEAKQALASM